MAQLKQFKRDEVAKCETGCTKFVLHDKVYDVTQFLNEHPGGEEVLLDHNGKDASEDFDDVGHSSDAQDLMKKYLIGEIVEAERKNTKIKVGWVAGKGKTEKKTDGPPAMFYLWVGGMIAFIVGSFIYYWS